MKTLVTGATGLVGSALVEARVRAGNDVWRLVRHTAPAAREISWNPATGQISSDALEGFDAVIHLAGENIAGGRWTAARKQRIRDSRVVGTTRLAEALAKLRQPPKVLISASAIGIYGSRGDELLTEKSSPGPDFLAQVCREWESATAAAERAGIRVVHLRFGIILSPRGGALAKLLPLFRLGLGGVVGNGGQFWSWVSLLDAVGSIEHALASETLRGPVNAVAPATLKNREFTRTLGRVLHRPAILPAPAWVLRLVFGEMAGATMLASARVQPARLLETGYVFQHPELESALRALVGNR